MPIPKPQETDPTKKEPDGELDFSLNEPQNLSYYCFGCFFLKKDGTIDYSKIGRDFTCYEEWIARMQFDAGDISDCAVYLPRNTSTGKWVLECRDYDFTKQDFENLKNTEYFKKFTDVLVKKVQSAFAALGVADEKELQAVGVDKAEVDGISKTSLRIITFLRSACKNPKIEQK